MFNFCWTPINLLICKFGQPHERFKGIHYFCRDRCFTAVTLAKYAFVIPLFVYTGVELTKYSYYIEEDSGLGEQEWPSDSLTHSENAFELGLVFIIFAA